MPAFHINSFKGGLSDYNKAGIKGSFQFGAGLDIRKDIDSLSCAYGLTEIGAGTFDEAIRFWVVDNEGSYIYAVGVTTIWEINRTTLSITQRYSSGTDITGAELIYHSSGKRYIYWADRQYLHRKELPGVADWSDVDADASWPKSDLENSSHIPHHMTEVSGSLVIANDNMLAYVGYDESYSTNVVEIPSHLTITNVLDRNGRAIMGTRRKNESGTGVNAMIDSELPFMQGGSSGQLLYSDMVNTVPLQKLPDGGYVQAGAVATELNGQELFLWEEGAVADPDVNSWISRKMLSNLIYFGVTNASSSGLYNGVWTYGRKKKNQPLTLNLEYPVSISSDVNSIYIDTVYTFISVDSDVYVVSTATHSTGTYIGLDLQVPNKLPSEATVWTMAELIGRPLPSGCSVEFWYRLERNGSYIQAELEGGSTSFDTSGETRALFKIGEKAQIFTPKVILNPSGSDTPEIYDIYIHFN